MLLIHSVSVSTPISEDKFGNVLYSEAVTVANVRLDFCFKTEFNGMNRVKKAYAVLIYDCTNSSPANFNFSEGQNVSVDGKSFTVSAVTPLYEKKRLHHVEVELI